MFNFKVGFLLVMLKVMICICIFWNYLEWNICIINL